ncbi:hypothetical protein [Sphingomonas sp. BAUL-RG-20F-R05-02]|uniref:hypothetical protein n=1 Tax=Sphingomonas sp. BAUL-RG-20F-R05-02 TaxID=2914830 RepID=UPI001F5670BC|nr:hypothetical protein [Sphingomonas sp. BAUL-RG-20F-R05-02]
MQQYLDLMRRKTARDDVAIVKDFNARGHPWMAFTIAMVSRIPFRFISTVIAGQTIIDHLPIWSWR